MCVHASVLLQLLAHWLRSVRSSGVCTCIYPLNTLLPACCTCTALALRSIKSLAYPPFRSPCSPHSGVSRWASARVSCWSCSTSASPWALRWVRSPSEFLPFPPLHAGAAAELEAQCACSVAATHCVRRQGRALKAWQHCCLKRCIWMRLTHLSFGTTLQPCEYMPCGCPQALPSYIRLAARTDGQVFLLIFAHLQVLQFC